MPLTAAQARVITNQNRKGTTPDVTDLVARVLARVERRVNSGSRLAYIVDPFSFGADEGPAPESEEAEMRARAILAGAPHSYSFFLHNGTLAMGWEL
jgi:hypothetical protein